MFIDQKLTPKRIRYNKKINLILIVNMIFLFLVFILLGKTPEPGMVESTLYIYLAIHLISGGILSYKEEIIGGYPDSFNYWEGLPAKISGVILVIIGLFFLLLSIKRFL